MAPTDSDAFSPWLNQLRTLLQLPIPEAAIGELKQHQDAFIQARKLWDLTIQDALSELKKVQDGLRKVDPELAAALPNVAHGYRSKLALLLDDAVRVADDEEANRSKESIMKEIDSLKDSILTDEVVKYIDSYAHKSVQIQHTFIGGLESIAELVSQTTI